jgi:hypothetical protein
MYTVLLNRTSWFVFTVVLALIAEIAYAAKPAGRGGSDSTSAESTAVDPPEFFWASFDHANRLVRLQGKHLITGEVGSPVFPQLYVGGELISVIDETESVNSMDFTTNIGAVLVPFDSILDVLGVIGAPPGLLVLEAGDNWEIKAVTSTGAAILSAYFPRSLKELPADTGVCPCTLEYGAYTKVDALAEATFCSSTEGISADEYVEAGYGKTDGSAVIIGSHSSWSGESLYSSTCYARDLSQVVNGVEEPQYLGSSPVQVGNGDHLLCVALIESLEATCSP